MYTAIVFALSKLQRKVIAVEGTPLAIVDAEEGKAYVLLEVTVGRTEDNLFHAMIPGINATGRAEVPSDAIFGLCASLKLLTEHPPEGTWGTDE